MIESVEMCLYNGIVIRSTSEGAEMLKSLIKRKKKSVSMVNGLKQGKSWFALILLIPALFNFFVFWLYPNFSSIVLSFQNSRGDWTIGNYEYVIKNLFSASGEIFAEAFRNTMIYFSVGYFITQTFNVLLSYFFYKKIAGYRIFRFLFYMPNILATVIMASVYKTLLGPQGPFVTALYEWGWIDEPLRLFSDARYAMIASVGYSMWLFVGGVLLWTSGAMARIPKQLLEAAALDGITPWKEFIYIVLPMISGTLSTLYIIGIAGILGSGGATLYLTFGDYGTMTLSFWIFKQVYTGGGTGTSSALGILMTVVTIPLIFFVKWLAGKLTAEVEY